MDKALLVFTGWNERAVLAVLRVAARHAVPVALVCRGADDPILRTPYRRHVVLVRDKAALDLADVAQAVATARSRLRVERTVVYPSSEFLNAWLLAHRDDLAALGCDVPLVDAAVYRRLSDKASATALMAAHGFAVPGERPGLRSAPPPLVAKPRANLGGNGARTLYPHLLFAPADIERFEREEDPADWFFQDYVEGASRYLLLHLARDGRVAAFSQRNLAQQPGGKSIVHAVPDDLHASDFARRFLALLADEGFHGLLMAEFIRAEGRDVFIEINPRPWGPLQLTVDCGAGLLEAFLGDCLHGDPARFPAAPAGSRPFAWSGGALRNWAQGDPVRWRPSRPRRAWWRWLRLLRHDVYLRRDSWWIFARETGRSLRLLFSRPPGAPRA